MNETDRDRNQMKCLLHDQFDVDLIVDIDHMVMIIVDLIDSYEVSLSKTGMHQSLVVVVQSQHLNMVRIDGNR